MMALEIVRPGTTEPDADSTRRIVQACHQAGVVALSCGSYGNVIRLLPPLIIDEALLEDGLGVMAESCQRILGSARSSSS
jgi:4-aminobutyrate aminotransferase/(S)-3-amino-2-methylpropionate transaminase